jgi:flagellar basal body-associated protein FliL
MSKKEEKAEKGGKEGEKEAKAPLTPEEEAAKSKKKKMILFGVIGLLVVGGGGAGAFFFLKGGKKPEAEKTGEVAHEGEEEGGAHGKAEHDTKGEHGEAKKDEHGGAHGETKKDDHGSGHGEAKKDGHGEAKKDEHGESKKDGHGGDHGESKKDEHGGGHGGGHEESKKAGKEEVPEYKGDFGQIKEFKPFHLNLGNPLENRYVRISIGVEYKGGSEQLTELDRREPQLRDVIVSVVSRKTREHLLSPDGKDQMRLELKNRINQYLDQKVETVFITDILIE